MPWLVVRYHPGFSRDLTSWTTILERKGRLIQRINPFPAGHTVEHRVKLSWEQGCDDLQHGRQRRKELLSRVHTVDVPGAGQRGGGAARWLEVVACRLRTYLTTTPGSPKAASSGLLKASKPSPGSLRPSGGQRQGATSWLRADFSLPGSCLETARSGRETAKS